MSRNKSARRGQPDEAVRLLSHPENEATTASKNLPIFDKATSRPDVQRLTPANILYLQNTVGNKAVQRLLADSKAQAQRTTTLQRVNWNPFRRKKSQKPSDQENLLKNSSLEELEDLEIEPLEELEDLEIQPLPDVEDVLDPDSLLHNQNNPYSFQNSSVQAPQELTKSQAKKLAKLNGRDQKALANTDYLASPLTEDYEPEIRRTEKLLMTMGQFKETAKKEDFIADDAQDLINRANFIMGNSSQTAPEQDKEFKLADFDKHKGSYRHGEYKYGNPEKDESSDEGSKDSDFKLDFVPQPDTLNLEPLNGYGTGIAATGKVMSSREKTSAEIKGSGQFFAGNQMHFSTESSFRGNGHDANFNGKFSQVTGVGGQGRFGAKVSTSGASLDAAVAAFLGSKTTASGSARYTYNKSGGEFSGAAEVMLGAEAAAKLEAALNTSGLSLEGQAGAFAGARINLKGKVDIIINSRKLAGLTGKATLLLGAGAEAGIKFKLSIHEIGLNVNAGAATGVGLSGEVGGSVSPSQIFGSAFDFIYYMQNYQAMSQGYTSMQPAKLDPLKSSSIFSYTYSKLDNHLKQLEAAQAKVAKAEELGTGSFLTKVRKPSK